MDIMIYDRFEYHKYNCLLNVIDVHSRFAMSKALTNHRAGTIVESLKEMFDEYQYPKYCHDDIPKFCLPNQHQYQWTFPKQLN